MIGGPARIISGLCDGDGDGVDWRFRMCSTIGGNSKLSVGVGAGDDAVSESRAFRMAATGFTTGDNAVSESRAFRMSSMTGGNSGVNVGLGASADANCRALKISSTT